MDEITRHTGRLSTQLAITSKYVNLRGARIRQVEAQIKELKKTGMHLFKKQLKLHQNYTTIYYLCSWGLHDTQAFLNRGYISRDMGSQNKGAPIREVSPTPLYRIKNTVYVFIESYMVCRKKSRRYLQKYRIFKQTKS